jgi:hypothetical protein
MCGTTIFVRTPTLKLTIGQRNPAAPTGTAGGNECSKCTAEYLDKTFGRWYDDIRYDT